jgi:cell division protein FtsB
VADWKTHAKNRRLAASSSSWKRFAWRIRVPFIWPPTVYLRRVIVALYLLMFLGLCTASGVYFWQAREEYNRLRRIEADTRQRLAEAEARLAEQEKILERLRTDPVYVEKVIRRRLGYAKPEEFIFRFED